MAISGVWRRCNPVIFFCHQKCHCFSHIMVVLIDVPWQSHHLGVWRNWLWVYAIGKFWRCINETRNGHRGDANLIAIPSPNEIFVADMINVDVLVLWLALLEQTFCQLRFRARDLRTFPSRMRLGVSSCTIHAGFYILHLRTWRLPCKRIHWFSSIAKYRRLQTCGVRTLQVRLLDNWTRYQFD